MEWEYYTNRSKKRKIDHLLLEAARIFANCENTKEARNEAKSKELAILDQIARYDRHFAESCGWINPNNTEEDSEFESVLRKQALVSTQEVQGHAA